MSNSKHPEKQICQIEPRKLNFGCGKDIRKGWVNFDLAKLPGVDVVGDFKRRLPFKDSTFDYILASHVLEHIPHHIGKEKDGLICVMEELHRILKPNGMLEIKVPHYRSQNAFIDPTHSRFFDVGSFAYFTKESKMGYYTEKHFGIKQIKISKYTACPFGIRIGKSALSINEHIGIRLPFLIPFIPNTPCEITAVLICKK